MLPAPETDKSLFTEQAFYLVHLYFIIEMQKTNLKEFGTETADYYGQHQLNGHIYNSSLSHIYLQVPSVL